MSDEFEMRCFWEPTIFEDAIKQVKHDVWKMIHEHDAWIAKLHQEHEEFLKIIPDIRDSL
jgi:hypothetical protein